MKPLNTLVRFSVCGGLIVSVILPAFSQQERNAQRRDAAPARIAAAFAERVERDVVYGNGGDAKLKLDIYHPKNAGTNPLPVAVYVHGGGWVGGDKGGGAGMMAAPELLKRGYLVASINYRLAPQHKFPAHIEDAKCAIRYLRAHADKYRIDPDRIGVFGSSAGGHIVSLLGTTDAKAGLEGDGGWTNQSSRVQAVVDIFGPADLTLQTGRKGSRHGENAFGAKSDDDPVLKRASPVTYVSKDDPPFLLLHGDKDETVPLIHSEALHKKLNAAGVPSTLVVVTNAGHGFGPAGGEIKPGREELARMIADFFDEHLKK